MKLPLKETIVTACAFAILMGMGTWQLQRREWKNDLIAKLNAGYDAPSKSLPFSAQQLDAWSQEKSPLGYGTTHAKLLRDKAILLGPRIEDGRSGYHLLIPAQLPDGHILIVNTGWVNDLWKDDFEERLSIIPADDIYLRGIIHKPDWSSFASQNSPANDMWFRADIDQIAKEKEIDSPYPFILYADSIDPPLHDVIMPTERWLPRNKHLQYALFWYALGFALLGVYGFYVAAINKNKNLH